jgi:sulfatase maturation enzyme AslB (radical SAM superfamily)
MVIQSLSVAVPAPCPNACGFCVSRMHSEDYPDQIEKNKPFRDLYKRDYADRLAFARDNGCNSLIFTGSGEPLCNQRFMEEVADLNQAQGKPFRILELQTSGVGLDEEALRWLRNTIRVCIVSLSLSSVWSSERNREYNATPEKLAVDIDGLCALVKRYDFTLRLSLNMTDEYDGSEPRDIFVRAKALGADQLTFRKLYSSGKDTEQDEWIARHGMREDRWARIDGFIRERGRRLERLPFGAWRYSVDAISTVVDDDCMSTAMDKDEIKYLVLRPNCKLYSKWDDTGSLLF